MISSVIFDLDDTLCDYAAAKRRALEAVCAELSLRTDEIEALLGSYTRIEPILFARFAAGEISRVEYRRRRFAETLGARATPDDALLHRLNERYMSVANGEVQLFPDAVSAVRDLKARGLVCAILTNGPSDGQRKKLHRAGLTGLFDQVFVSEEIGYAKPQPEAFWCVAKALGHEPKAMVMVGDSIADDIAGAESAGMHAVLLDRRARHPAHRGPRVSSLHELVPFVLRLTAQEALDAHR